MPYNVRSKTSLWLLLLRLCEIISLFDSFGPESLSLDEHPLLGGRFCIALCFSISWVLVNISIYEFVRARLTS